MRYSSISDTHTCRSLTWKRIIKCNLIGYIDKEKDIGLPTLHSIRWSGVHE
jgi:hypothetical protein